MEVCLIKIPKSCFIRDAGRLRARLNETPTEFIFKNILCSQRGDETFLWLTMQPETNQLTPRTVTDLLKVLVAIKKHAEMTWRCSLSVANCIGISKIDLTMDLEGSFIPNLGYDCR